jgi:hypothetical protein
MTMHAIWLWLWLWLYTGSWFGLHRIAWLLITAGLAADWLLGRSTNPRLRSVAGALSQLLFKVLTALHLDAIPIFGPLIVSIFNAIATPEGKVTTKRAELPTPAQSGPPKLT